MDDLVKLTYAEALLVLSYHEFGKGIPKKDEALNEISNKLENAQETGYMSLTDDTAVIAWAILFSKHNSVFAVHNPITDLEHQKVLQKHIEALEKALWERF